MQKDFPDLYNYIKNYILILEHLNAWGRTHLIEDNLNKDGVFFISSNYIADLINKDQSVITKVINCFTVLGLINKIQEKDVPMSVKEMASNLTHFNMVNFYTIEKYDTKTLLEAQKIVLKLKNAKITTMTLTTRANVEKIFGKPFAKKVYGIKALTKDEREYNMLKNMEM